MDRVIEVKVAGNHLIKDNRNAGVAGEANATALRIEFDEGWDGYAKTVTWVDARGENPTGVILTADKLEDILASTRIYLTLIPGEALTLAGETMFAIDGYINGKRQRSAYGKLVVRPGDVFVALEDVTPTQAEQLQVQIDSLLSDIQTDMQAAQDAAELAEESAEQAVESAVQSGDSAERAEESAAQAAKSEINAGYFSEQAVESASKAEAAVGKTSYIGENGNWYEWDSETGSFADSGISATQLVDINTGEAVRMWFGTVAEYNDLPLIERDVYYNILEGEAHAD